MKTAVSIPDQLFDRVESLAHRLGKSRSQVYREALAEYVARRDHDTVTSALDAAVAAADGDADEWLTEAGRRALARTEW